MRGPATLSDCNELLNQVLLDQLLALLGRDRLTPLGRSPGGRPRRAPSLGFLRRLSFERRRLALQPTLGSGRRLLRLLLHRHSGLGSGRVVLLLCLRHFGVRPFVGGHVVVDHRWPACRLMSTRGSAHFLSSGLALRGNDGDRLSFAMSCRWHRFLFGAVRPPSGHLLLLGRRDAARGWIRANIPRRVFENPLGRRVGRRVPHALVNPWFGRWPRDRRVVVHL